MQSTSSEVPSDSTIIRTGSDGRLRYTPEQREGLLDAFSRSGQSAMAFARQHGVSYQTFIAWLRKRREIGASLAPDAPAFAEVMVRQPASAAAALRIVLPCRSPPNLSPPSAKHADTLRQPARLPRARTLHMRKSFDGLHAEVVDGLGEDPRGGAVFVFINKSRKQRKRGPQRHLKILAALFHRRHSPAVYEAYERILSEDR